VGQGGGVGGFSIYCLCFSFMLFVFIFDKYFNSDLDGALFSLLLYFAQKLGAHEDPEDGRVEEGQDEKEGGVHRIADHDDPERRDHQDRGEKDEHAFDEEMGGVHPGS
jgi:hypothetical protein